MPVLFIDSGGVVEATYRDNQTSNATVSTANTRTFADMAIGPASPNRYVVACLAWSVSGNPTAFESASIGGVAATELVSAGTSLRGVTIVIALVPDGTTADVDMKLVTSSGATWADSACVVFSVAGISSLVAADDAADSSANPTGSLSCEPGGAIIGCAQSINNPVRTAVWTGIAEDIECTPYGFGNTRKFTAAHTNFIAAQSSLACTCTFSGSSSGGADGAFVAFNPS